MGFQITKKIELNNSGVFLAVHQLNDNIFYNRETKIVQGTIASFVDATKSPVKASSFRFTLKNAANIDAETESFISDDTNLDIIINGPRPKLTGPKPGKK
jgi:hypothetical protein